MNPFIIIIQLVEFEVGPIGLSYVVLKKELLQC